MRKIDSLIGTILAAVLGLMATQVEAFIHEYRQRLGGHLDQARLHYERVMNGEAYAALDPEIHQAIGSQEAAHVSRLAEASHALAEASVVTKPFVFLAEMDVDIARATLTLFRPSLPLDPAAMVYGLVGIVAGWILYEALKLPFALLLWRHPTPARQ